MIVFINLIEKSALVGENVEDLQYSKQNLKLGSAIFLLSFGIVFFKITNRLSFIRLVCNFLEVIE